MKHDVLLWRTKGKTKYSVGVSQEGIFVSIDGNNVLIADWEKIDYCKNKLFSKDAFTDDAKEYFKE